MVPRWRFGPKSQVRKKRASISEPNDCVPDAAKEAAAQIVVDKTDAGAAAENNAPWMLTLAPPKYSAITEYLKDEAALDQIVNKNCIK